jgi:hypothetical protein
MRTLGGQLKEALSDALGLSEPQPPYPPRLAVVEKVSRNAIAELVNQARNHPQRGEPHSANPAYAALAELTIISGIPGLALGLRHETGEISFLDLDMDQETVAKQGGAFLPRPLNRTLWRRLKNLSIITVDRTMQGPSKPIRSPEEAYIPEEEEYEVDENENR